MDRAVAAEWERAPGVLVDFTLVNDLLLNVDLGGSGKKQGSAAVGRAADDYWNTYRAPGLLDGTLEGLRYADGTASGASLRVRNAAGEYANLTGDAMFDTYLYQKGAEIELTFAGLESGRYDVYVYGRGAGDALYGSFAVNDYHRRLAVGPFWAGEPIDGRRVRGERALRGLPGGGGGGGGAAGDPGAAERTRALP